MMCNTNMGSGSYTQSVHNGLFEAVIIPDFYATPSVYTNAICSIHNVVVVLLTSDLGIHNVVVFSVPEQWLSAVLKPAF